MPCRVSSLLPGQYVCGVFFLFVCSGSDNKLLDLLELLVVGEAYKRSYLLCRKTGAMSLLGYLTLYSVAGYSGGMNI